MKQGKYVLFLQLYNSSMFHSFNLDFIKQSLLTNIFLTQSWKFVDTIGILPQMAKGSKGTILKHKSHSPRQNLSIGGKLKIPSTKAETLTICKVYVIYSH